MKKLIQDLTNTKHNYYTLGVSVMEDPKLDDITAYNAMMLCFAVIKNIDAVIMAIKTKHNI